MRYHAPKFIGVELAALAGVFAVALAAAAFAAGALLAQSGLVVLGLVFLAEELYETGVLALIIRSGDYE